MNKEAKEFINQAETKIAKVKNHQELDLIVSEIKSYKVQHGLKAKLAGPLAAVVTSTGATTFMVDHYLTLANPGNGMKTLMFVLIAATAGSVFSLVSRNSKLDKLASLIYKKDALLDNSLIEHQVDKVKKFYELAANFQEFRNKRSEVSYWIESRVNNELNFHVFHYAYETRTGGRHPETNKFERYGFVVKLPLKYSFLILPPGKYCEKYSTLGDSPNRIFNEKFKFHGSESNPLMGDEEFLDSIINFNKFSDLQFEVSDGLMCVSFSNNPLKIRENFSVTQIEELSEDLKAEAKLPLIQEFRDFVNYLSKLKVVKTNSIKDLSSKR